MNKIGKFLPRSSFSKDEHTHTQKMLQTRTRILFLSNPPKARVNKMSDIDNKKKKHNIVAAQTKNRPQKSIKAKTLRDAALFEWVFGVAAVTFYIYCGQWRQKEGSESKHIRDTHLRKQKTRQKNTQTPKKKTYKCSCSTVYI